MFDIKLNFYNYSGCILVFDHVSDILLGFSEEFYKMFYFS